MGFCRPWRGLHWSVMGVVPSVETLGYCRMSLRDKALLPAVRAQFWAPAVSCLGVDDWPNADTVVCAPFLQVMDIRKI